MILIKIKTWDKMTQQKDKTVNQESETGTISLVVLPLGGFLASYHAPKGTVPPKVAITNECNKVNSNEKCIKISTYPRVSLRFAYFPTLISLK